MMQFIMKLISWAMLQFSDRLQMFMLMLTLLTAYLPNWPHSDYISFAEVQHTDCIFIKLVV